LRSYQLVQERHAALHVERGSHTFERQPQLHERDGDSGLHSNHHRLRIQHAGHGGDVADHSADERVHHLERGDVHEDTSRTHRDDALGEILLQLQSEPVMHVHLDRDQEKLAHPQNRNLFHGSPPLPQVPVGSFACTRRMAIMNASARLALVVTSDRSTPRCTIVCAICGRMPLMMQSAPIRRAAATVFSRCWATRVSTVGTPVMSMMAMAAPVSTIFCSRLSITTCVRSLSSVPMSGSARMLSHSSTTGVDNSNSSRCCREITSSRFFWYISAVRSPSWSSSTVASHREAARASASRDCSARSRVKSGCLSENTNVAVSVGVKPCRARLREMPARNSLTGAQT